MPVKIREDTRLAALATDTSRYVFRIPDGASNISVDANLILRRAYAELMIQKGWTAPDILM